MSEPKENARLLRNMCLVAEDQRITITHDKAIEIADQLVGLEAEHRKNLAQLCSTEEQLSKALYRRKTEES